MRLVGLDVAGWQDVAARDWDIDHADDVIGALRVIDGGVASVAIRDRSDRWIGGPQAVLAPHGLGKGWGELGGSDRRISISECHDALINGQDAKSDAYGAAVASLSRHAEEAILNVSDLATTDEAARGRILRTVRGKLKRTRLLWRPVALFLDALRVGLINPDKIGRRIGFLVHSGSGFEFQTLCLREDSEHPGHFAPEREGYGILIGGSFGFSQLVDHVHEDVLRANPILAEKTFGRIEISPGILTGRITLGSRQVVRHNNGNWIELRAPEQVKLPTSSDLVDQFSKAIGEYDSLDKVFLATPLAPSLAAILLKSLQRVHSDTLQIDWQALATGALHAGRIVERGLPHYFDRLVPIGLAVFQGEEPIFVDLVDRTATLPANKEYISPPRKLEWPSTKNELEFCVLKGDNEVRQWKLSVPEAPGIERPVELILRQTPGQSWAKLDLSSRDWDILLRSPISLDWETLKPLEETPEEVLKRLRKPPPTIPTMIVEDANIVFWTGNQRIASMLQILSSGEAKPHILAKALSRSTRILDDSTGNWTRVWTIGTDGALPDDISSKDAATLDRVMAPIAEVVLTAAKTGQPLSANHELRALTWMFTKCPDAVQTAVVEALEAEYSGMAHALLVPTAAGTVLVQGAGRAVTGKERIRRVLTVLVAVHPFVAGRKANSNTFNALAMLLARRREAPDALNPKLVARIARIVADELETTAQAKNPGKFRVRFKNAMSALAGLFRYREVEPYALLKGDDPTAGRLWEDLEKIRFSLISARAHIPQADAKIAIVGELLKLLEGQGDPDILRRIEASESEALDEENE